MGSKYDDYELIYPNSAKKKTFMVISILKNRSINFNKRLLEEFPKQKVEMKIHPLAKEIVLKDQGDVMITLSKNGRIHNDDVIIKLEKNAIKLPAYYIFEKDQEEDTWGGELHYKNPNRGKKRSK